MPKAAAKSKRTAKPKKDREHEKREQALDEALAGSFPSSDPVSVTQPAPATQPEHEADDQSEADKAGRNEKQPA
ncbi:MAG TPA: hypothetical protein VKT73_05060 [Xanthobacteraceae bacterium]|nr:hypothetical protein [Xanthobacteraceae bacterium]